MNIKRLTRIGVFTAILGILSIVAIPSPTGVPLTLQTFAMALVGFVLGKKDATISVFIYIILGLIGIPIFSGMTGGIGKIIGPTGGFIFGFLFLAFFSGFNFKNKVYCILFSFIGLIICHILGILQFSFVTKNHIIASFLTVSLPYLIKDIISVIFAYIFGNFLKRVLIKDY